MLDKKVIGIDCDASGKTCGVRCEEGLYKASTVIGDPTYFPDRVRKIGVALSFSPIWDPADLMRTKGCTLSLLISAV